MSDLSALQLEDTARLRGLPPRSRFRLWFARIAEPQILFPGAAVLILALLWGVTVSLVRINAVNADATVRRSVGELVNTYQAEAVNAMSAIDQTLKLIQYTAQSQPPAATLATLKDHHLLPSELVFGVRITDPNGQVLAHYGTAGTETIDADTIAALRKNQGLWVSRATRNGAGDWSLRFARALSDSAGRFSGAALLDVDASFFVSGYESAQLGQHGLLGLLGVDGVFRVWRSGESVAANDAASYGALSDNDERGNPIVLRTRYAWDGVTRDMAGRELYGYPLAVVVGVSEEEMLSPARLQARDYLIRAALASLLLIAVTIFLGRASWQLARARARENEAKLEYARRIEYLAYHDGLTALPNRSLFNKLLSQSISKAQRRGERLAVAFIDLDRFKQINDTLGHEAGDQLLQQVALRLKSCLRESDLVARLGGDEFVVLLTDLSDPQYASTVARKIISALAHPFTLLKQDFRVTASIGICVYPDDGRDEQTLTKNADIAMYQAKEDGKNTFQFYSEKLNANSLERLSLESNLRHALERDEFRLFYQAKRDMRSGQITGMEALLRWQHVDLGLVPPLRFLPIAEETGLIVPIGRWVLKTACEQNVRWLRQGLPRLCVSVNLTSRQFSDENLLQDIETILKDTGLPAELLELEIHESLLLHDIDKTLRILTGMKAMGLRIAIDDFGTGYSSLGTLQRFPLDTIKIDRSYIRDIAERGEDGSLTENIIDLGKSLSLTVVAQGVETKAQADFLRQHACDEIQGFYFNRPVEEHELTALLREQAAGYAPEQDPRDSTLDRVRAFRI